MGDWNLKVGKQSTSDVTGQYNLVRNDRRARLVHLPRIRIYNHKQLVQTIT